MSINFESHKLDRRSFLKGAGMVGAASLLAACGGKSDNGSSAASTSGAAAPNTTGATPLKEFISFESGNRELESWNMLYTQKAEDANVVTNLWDGLLSFDRYGKVVPAIASSWEHNEDATVWTFHLRDENWVDCNGEVLGPVTAQDFVDALAYVLNPDYASSTASLVTPYVAGADDYYNYCVYRNNANNGTVAEDGTTYAIDANGTVTAAAADGTTTEYPAVDFSTVVFIYV